MKKEIMKRGEKAALKKYFSCMLMVNTIRTEQVVKGQVMSGVPAGD